MANAAKLREQARAAENRGQWADAVGLYRQVLEEGDEADTALWNRVGDLHLKTGETDRAVEAYERAVGGYADSGYFNNAIALCRKILRLVPGRTAVYLRLGQISAAAGFLPDARQNFLEYAERMRRAGKLDASFEALKEFADLSPEDTEVRRLLADQLLSHGRREEAVEQLRALIGAHQQRGDAGAAARVREQILAIDPQAETTPLVRKRSTEDDDFFVVLDDGSGRAPRSPAPPTAPEHADDVHFGSGLEPADVELDDGAADVAPLPGLETTAWDDAPPAAEPEPAFSHEPEPAAWEPEEEEEDGGADEAPLPLLPDGGGMYALPEEDAEEEDREDDDALPMLTFDDGDAVEEEPAPSPAADPLERMRAHVASAPEDAAARDELVRELRARGLDEEIAEVLETAHRALAARGLYHEAVAPITALIGLRPDDGLLLQKRVEYAFRSGRREAQVEAYLGLGRHLARHGREEKAAAVFKRVLELDPHNVEARTAAAQVAAALAPERPARAAGPAASPEREGEYVDLATLVLSAEEGAAGSTRFVVEEKEPSGDEDRDFAEMLAHFRQKVAENIEVEDSASHYDLGVAFMEMGLFDEAIAQFQVALRGGAKPLATLELLGQCFVEKEQYAVGSRVLDRALRLPGVSDGDLVGVLYLLGRVAEGTGSAEQALAHYERVVAVDIRFRDTAKRIERLREAVGGHGF
jgi:tetratricopeptide (TPR) repeat protein